MSRFFEKQALGLDGTIVRHHKRWCVEFDPAIAAAFETPDCVLKRCDFSLQFGDALDELVFSLRRAAPFDSGDNGLFAPRDLELDEVRNAEGLLKDDGRAVFRQVAHQAGGLAASFVEINDTAEEALLASAGVSFVHRQSPAPDGRAGIVWLIVSMGAYRLCRHGWPTGPRRG